MLVTNLPREKCRYAVAGIHAKVAILAGPVHTWVIEGSANLRSCQNVEQAIVCIDDAEAVRFHGLWLDRIFERFELGGRRQLTNREVWAQSPENRNEQEQSRRRLRTGQRHFRWRHDLG